MKLHIALLSGFFLLTAFAPLPAQSQKPPGAEIEWARDWEEALQEAQARNVPIMFTIHKDG